MNDLLGSFKYLLDEDEWAWDGGHGSDLSRGR